MADEFENYGIDDIVENDEKGLYNETYDGSVILSNLTSTSESLPNAVNELTTKLTGDALDKATELGENLKNLGANISLDNLKAMAAGNFEALSGSAMTMAGKLGLPTNIMEDLKNKPTAIMDSMLTEVQDNFKSLTNHQQLLSNLSGNLPIDFKSMVENADFTKALSKAGIGSSIIKGLDLSNITGLDDIKTQIAEKMNIPTDGSNIVSNAVNTSVSNVTDGASAAVNNAVSGITSNISNMASGTISNATNEITNVVSGTVNNAVSGITNGITNGVTTAVNNAVSNITGPINKITSLTDITNVLDQAVGGASGLIKNFAVNELNKVALSEISSKVPANILKRFIG